MIELKSTASSKVEDYYFFNALFRLAKEWRKSQSLPLEAPTPEEVDIDIKEVKDFNRLLMNKLAEVADQHPEIENKLQQMCEEVKK